MWASSPIGLKEPKDFAPFRVLFVRLRSLGDTVLMTPMLKVMGRMPGWTVGVLVEKSYEEVLEGNPHVDNIFVIDNHCNKWTARMRAIREIRSFRPTLAIDLHGGTTGAILTALSGAKKRVGHQKGRLSYLYNVKVPPSTSLWQKNHVHTVEHQMSLLKYLGFPVEPVPSAEVLVSDSNLDMARGLLEGVGLCSQQLDKGFILIHPAAAFDTKQWESEHFALLATLLGREGLKVVFTAGPGQEALLEKIKRRCIPEVRFVAPQSVKKFTALASLCRLYVGNDTGSTHIAAALEKPVVVIFGSSDSKAWYPWKTEYRLIKSDLPCIPCPGYFCLHYDEPRCIRSISVEAVFRAVQSLL